MVNKQEDAMKDYKYYENAGVYPAKEDFKTVFVYKAGGVLVNGVQYSSMPKADLTKHANANDMIEVVMDKDAFNAAVTIYQTRQNELEAEFKADLFEEFGVTGNAKADQLYSVCWMRNHSGGFSDVLSIFSDFVDLIR